MITEVDIEKVVAMLYNNSTAKTYRSALLPLVGREFTQASIQSWIANWYGISRSTVVVRTAALKRLVRIKNREGGEIVDLDEMEYPIGIPAKKRRAITDEEVGRMLTAAKTDEDKLIVAVLYNTGIRAGTAVKIDFAALPDGDAVIAVESKRGKQVKVYLDRETVALARRARLDILDGSGDNAAYKRLYRAFRRLAKKAGVEGVSPHCMRHTFAEQVAEEHGLEVAMAAMGHSNLATTVGYIDAGKRAERAVRGRTLLGEAR